MMPLLGMVRMVVIAATDAQACAVAAPAYARWFETFTFLSRNYNLPAPPGLPSSFEQATGEGFCIAGSSATVRDELEKQVIEGAVTYILCHIAFGDLSLAASLQTISSMRAAIIPAFTSAAPISNSKRKNGSMQRTTFGK
jgi:alkanesulfonate monooxygenase SsuD/methylene tetrahydromethanopterin reductase-like flavin-dependent oxidoreductase (luciferase family)